MASQDQAVKKAPFGGAFGGGGTSTMARKKVTIPDAGAALGAIDSAMEEAEELAAVEKVAKKKTKRRGGGCGCFDNW